MENNQTPDKGIEKLKVDAPAIMPVCKNCRSKNLDIGATGTRCNDCGCAWVNNLKR